VVRVPCYRSRGPGFDPRRYHIFWEAVGLERGPLSLVSSLEKLLRRKSSGSGLENREYCRGRSAALSTRHPLSLKVRNNFADMRWSLADSAHGVQFSASRKCLGTQPQGLRDWAAEQAEDPIRWPFYTLPRCMSGTRCYNICRQGRRFHQIENNQPLY
jgi:hypothetical protein